MPRNDSWSNLSRIVYRRTYSRKDTGVLENWSDTVDRVIGGNTRKIPVSDEERNRLRYFMLNRKAIPAGRGLWFSGSPAHERLGLIGACNCFALTADHYEKFVIGMDYLMLGGGVGMSVEHRFSSKLPRVKKDVTVVHKCTKDADFIVPDSREGWCELMRRVLEAFFVTGKSFSYSTICIRGAGEDIKTFGGKASGPIPLIAAIEQIAEILTRRAGRHLHPIDAMDVFCCIGQLVVAGNVRRSAIIILGDPWDKEYLRSKRWSLGNIPNYRAFANLSVVCDDIEDVHPSFWKTYEDGEPFGIVNRKAIQTYGRMGEEKPDSAMVLNPCGEIPLEDAESCNLTDIPLTNLDSIEEFEEGARLMYRYAKRVAQDKCHVPLTDAVVKKNNRIGVGITGCLASPLFRPDILDRVYQSIQEENRRYSQELNAPISIRTTTIKPSGTVSKVLDCHGYEGIHPAFSRYIIQRVRFSSDDSLIPVLRAAGHKIEPQIRFDGTYDNGTLVVDFYVEAPNGYPVADEDWTTWKQLDVVKMAQRYWSDNSVSVTVYYKKEELSELKTWLEENLKYIKTISFLCSADHGFKQAPKEAISKDQFEKMSRRIKTVNFDQIMEGEMESQECAAGVCPVK